MKYKILPDMFELLLLSEVEQYSCAYCSRVSYQNVLLRLFPLFNRKRSATIIQKDVVKVGTMS